MLLFVLFQDKKQIDYSTDSVVFIFRQGALSESILLILKRDSVRNKKGQRAFSTYT